MGSSKLEVDGLTALKALQNKVRLKIIKMLLEFEFRSLSDIAEKLKALGCEMTLSGVLKHMRTLEKMGIVRHQPGIFSDKPDARKTIYFLEGRERIEEVLRRLENDVLNPLRVGVVFCEAAKLARRIQGMSYGLMTKEKKRLRSFLDECESEGVHKYLTRDEKKKVKLWRMMLSLM